MSGEEHSEHTPGQADWLTDQIRAAEADARRELARSGGIQHAPAGTEPAVDRLKERLGAQLAAGFYGDCGHFEPRVAQPVHWVPAVKDVWQCGPCAKLLVDDWLREDYDRCDLCQRALSHGDQGVITTEERTLFECTAGVIIIHAVLCAECG
jgi:hypothetical protein